MTTLRAWAGYVTGIGLIVLALCKVLPTGVAAVGFVLGLALLVVASLVNLRRSARGSVDVGAPGSPGMYVGDGGGSGHHHAHGGHGGFIGHGGFGGHGGGHGG